MNSKQNKILINLLNLQKKNIKIDYIYIMKNYEIYIKVQVKYSNVEGFKYKSIINF